VVDRDGFEDPGRKKKAITGGGTPEARTDRSILVFAKKEASNVGAKKKEGGKQGKLDTCILPAGGLRGEPPEGEQSARGRDLQSVSPKNRG